MKMVGPSSFSLEWRTRLSLSRPLPLPPLHLLHLGAYPPPADLRPQHAYAVRTRSPSGCIAAVGDRLSHQRGSREVRAHRSTPWRSSGLWQLCGREPNQSGIHDHQAFANSVTPLTSPLFVRLWQWFVRWMLFYLHVPLLSPSPREKRDLFSAAS